MKTRGAVPALLGLFLLLAGCGPTISPALQGQAWPSVGFAALAAQPEEYRGRVVILGGEVISVSLKDGKSLLSVSQQELDAQLRPVSGTGSGGSFLVESDKWLSPSEYVPKRKVTVAGVVQGAYQGKLFLEASEVTPGDYPPWEKWYYPVPRDWYDPSLEYWYTPPYFDPWRGGGGHRH